MTSINKQFLGYPSAAIRNFLHKQHYTRIVTLAVEPTTAGTATGAGRYNIGATAHLQAIPNVGCSFLRWSDGNTNADRYIEVNDNISLTAYFEQTTCTLTVQSNDTRYGTASGSGTYNKGVQVELKAIPTPQGEFVKWNDGDTSQTRIVTVDSDKTYIAEFQPAIGKIYYRPNY